MSLFTLFADRPVGDAEDQIWFVSPKDRTSPRPLREQLEQVAATIVAPLAPGASPSPSLTVAIHGACGSGKSSALNVLWDLALAKARALGEGAAGEAIAARLVRCSFVSPQWHKPDLDARTTLVAAMLVSLAGSEAKVVSSLIVPTGSISSEIKEASEPRDPQGRRLWASETLNKIAAAVAKQRDVDDLLRSWLDGNEGKEAQGGKEREPRVLAMLIDDLDRCELPFAYDVLNELQELGTLDNFFFVVAASPETVRRAVAARVPGREGDPQAIERELAKLVQHTVSVPPVDVDGMRALLEHLLVDKLAGGSADPVAAAIVESAPLLLLGLAEATPRALKRCLNFLVARLGEGAAERATAPELRVRIKRLLLEYTWPDFYRGWFEPMTSSGPARNLPPVMMLEETASRAALVDGTDRRITHELTYVCDAFPWLPWRDLPIALLRFLSAPPRLVTASSQAAPPRMTAPANTGAPAVASDDEPSRSPRGTRSLTKPFITFGGVRNAGGFESLGLRTNRTMDMAAPGKAPSGRGKAPSGRGKAPSEPPGAGKAPLSDPNEGVGPDPNEGVGPDPDDVLPPGGPADPSPVERVLDEAERDVAKLALPLARLDRAAHAIFALRDLGGEADVVAMSLARGLWPSLCAAPRDGAMLCPVMDAYVTLLEEHGLRGTAGAVLQSAYAAAGDQPHVRERYSLFLTGAGALQAARRVNAHEPVELHDLVSDDPEALRVVAAAAPLVQPLLRAVSAAST